MAADPRLFMRRHRAARSNAAWFEFFAGLARPRPGAGRVRGWTFLRAFAVGTPLVAGLIVAATGGWRGLPFFLVLAVCNAVLVIDANRYRAAAIAMLALAAFLLGLGVAITTMEPAQ